MKRIRWIGFFLYLVLSVGIAFAAKDLSLLLEKAIYTEGTLGDLTEAAKIYQEIIDDSQAGRDVAAEALFRLGKCYQKSGRPKEAFMAFSRLAELYPEQEALIALTQGIEPDKADFQSAPWADGEVLEYNVMNKGSGSRVHASIRIRTDSITQNGKPGWQIRSDYWLSSMVNHRSVWADAIKYQPGYSRLKWRPTLREIRANYRPDSVHLTIMSDGDRSDKEVTVERDVFDETQIPPILRCLPLEEGYRTVLPVFDPATSSGYNALIEVVAREEIVVPAGTFDCYKIAVTRGKNKEPYWVSADSNRTIVKMTYNRNQDVQLRSRSVVDRIQPVHYKDAENGFSLTLPPLWDIQYYIADAYIYDPEGESSCQVTISEYKPGFFNPEKPIVTDMFDYWTKYSESYYKVFRVRPGSRKITTESDRTIGRAIADYNDLISGEKLVFYYNVIAQDGRSFAFRFIVDPDSFERLKPQFDSIMESLKF